MLRMISDKKRLSIGVRPDLCYTQICAHQLIKELSIYFIVCAPSVMDVYFVYLIQWLSENRTLR